MPWLMLILTALAGLHYAQEISRVVAFEAGEVRLLILGVLAGLFLSFVVGVADSWLADARRRL